MARKKDTYPLRLRIDDDPRIELFLNSQGGGYGDVLRYLIEKEIAENGIRDLTILIPAKRDIDTLASTINIDNEIVPTKVNSISNNKLPEEKVEPKKLKENDRIMNLIKEKRNERRSLQNREETTETEIVSTDKFQVDNNIDGTKDNEKKEELPEEIIPSCYE